MNKKSLIILAIVFQITVLCSFIVRYEYLKATGMTLYVPLRGYDPTDIFRGDYVNLRYEFPYESSGSADLYRSRYIVPKIEWARIVGVESMSEREPTSKVFFQIKNASANSTREIILSTSTWELMYRDTSCGYTHTEKYLVWEEVYYEKYENNPVSYIYKIANNNSSSQPQKKALIKSLSSCIGTLGLTVSDIDRWFVPDGRGLDLEKKIREGKMYAEWKVGSNGAVIITDVLSEESLPK